MTLISIDFSQANACYHRHMNTSLKPIDLMNSDVPIKCLGLRNAIKNLLFFKASQEKKKKEKSYGNHIN